MLLPPTMKDRIQTKTLSAVSSHDLLAVLYFDGIGAASRSETIPSRTMSVVTLDPDAGLLDELLSEQ